MSAPKGPADNTAAPSARGRRRWPWIVGGVVGLLVLAVLLAPLIAAPLVKGMLLDTVHESTHARAALDDFSLSLAGNVHAGGFRLDDAAGQRVADVRSVDVHADVFGALSGRYAADVTVDGLSVHARQDADGQWNLVALTRPRAGAAGEQADTHAADQASEPLPQVKFSLRVRNGLLAVHGPGGTTELRELTVSLDIDDLSRPAPFHVSGKVVGPAGPGGELDLHGNVRLAREGRFDPDDIEAELDYVLRGLMLAALKPALAAMLPLDEATGTADGKGHWNWHAPLQLAGDSSFELHDVRLAGAALGNRPFVMPAASLQAAAALAPDGGSTQTVTLDAGELLALSYGGRISTEGSRQRAEGKLALSGRLAPMLLAAREHLGIKPTVDVDGALEVRSDVSAQWGPAGLGMAGVDARITLGGLDAREADGTPLPLGELTDLVFDFAAEADLGAGTARLSRMRFDFGPVTATAQAQVGGLSMDAVDRGGLALQDSGFAFDADLDRLAQSLAPLLDVEAPPFGGRIVASGTALTEGEVVRASTKLALTGLVWRGSPDGAPGDLGPLDLTLEQEGTLDLAPGGVTELRRFALRSSLLDVDANGSFSDLADAERIEGRIEHHVELHPGPLAAMADRLIGGLIRGVDVDGGEDGGVSADGQALVEEGTLHLRGRRLDAQGRLTAPALSARIGARGEPSAPGTELTGLDTSYALVLDTAAQTLTLDEFDVALNRFAGMGLTLGTLSAKGHAALDLAGGGMTLHVEPTLSGQELLALSDGTRLRGAPLSGVVDLRKLGDIVDVTGGLRGKRVQIELPPAAEGGAARELVQQDLALDFDLGGALGADDDALTVRTLRYASATARLTAAGRLEHISIREQTAADLRFGAQGEIARMLADAGALLPMEGTEARGALTLDGTLVGDAGQLTLNVDSRVKDFWLTVAPPDGAQPIVVSDPNVQLTLAADIATGPLDVTLTRGQLDSSFLAGVLTGEARNLRAWLEAGAPDSTAPAPAPVPVRVDADMTYDAAQIGALLAAWLPGHFTGEGRRPLKLTLKGDLSSGQGLAVLQGFDATGSFVLAPFQMTGLLAAGDLGIDLADGIAKVTGDLTLNGGQGLLGGALDLRPAASSPRSSLTFTLHDLKATEPMGRLLASMHPLFAAGGNMDVGSLSGALEADIELSWDGALPLTAAELASLPLERLGGHGTVSFPDVALRGSPLLGDMLGRLGEGEEKQVSISPLSFAIAAGRLSYAEPWPWKVSGTPTTFTGSMGLDGGLALEWNVPVTEKLMQKYKFLSRMQGQSLAIPIRGTVSDPKLKWSDVLDDLAKKSLQAELEDKLKDKLGGVLPGGDAGAGLSPEELLSQADALWAAGKHDEARPLYKRLKDDFKLTLVYLLNKDRIKDRAKGP